MGLLGIKDSDGDEADGSLGMQTLDGLLLPPGAFMAVESSFGDVA